MSRQPITIGELPIEAPVRVNSNSIIATISGPEYRHWIAPEAIQSSAQSGVSVGVVTGDPAKPSTVGVHISMFETPTSVNCFLVDEDEISDWAIRLIPVTFNEAEKFIGPMYTYSGVSEDAAADISAAAASIGSVQDSTDDLSLWYGYAVPESEKQLMPSMYLQEKFRTGLAIAQVGSPIPFHSDQAADNDIARISYAAILKSILDSILRVKHQTEPGDSFRLFHSAIALYSIVIRSGIGLPRQFDPVTFDGVFTMANTMNHEWRIDLRRISVCLGLEDAKDPNSQWEEEDIVVKFDEKDSIIVADLQNLLDKHPDGVFTSYLVKVKDPQIADGLPRINEMIEYLGEYGIDIDPEGFDPNQAYTYATRIGFKNSVFREWVLREPNESKGISISLFEDDDNEQNPPPRANIEG